MTDQQHIPDAPLPVRGLLRSLHEAGLTISQHIHTPHPQEWFAGDAGPYESWEAAMIGGVRWLRGLYESADQDRQHLAGENRALHVALQALRAEHQP